MTSPPIFDGHNDALLRMWRAGSPDAFSAGGPGHVDIHKARAGGLGGGFFAIFVPNPTKTDFRNTGAEYAFPVSPRLDPAEALQITLEQAAIALELERRGDLALCRTGSELVTAFHGPKIAALLHLEGADGIGPDLAALDVLFAAGLRSIGPVWSRSTIFAEGAPFRFPGDADVGPGLTDHGHALVKRAAELGMVVDLSHMNLAGFHDVADHGIALIATHSNAYHLCRHSRNLTDDQLRMIGQSGGMVGLNFATACLRPDGQMRPDDALEQIPRHLEHMIQLAGETHVGLGSDFDGAVVPQEIGDASGLDALRTCLLDAGFGNELVERICWRNWMETLQRILPEEP